jgi:O-antigen/teichoic acid export membrane protein
LATSSPDLKPSLRQRVINAGSWAFGGYAIGQVLRLASNLILARLLFPEAFGIMAIATAIYVGVVMLTDVGIGQSIIVHQDGGDDLFLDTAWALQIIKGTLIAVVLALGSGWAADFYDDNRLHEIVLIIAAAALIGGFNSTKLQTAHRNMQERQFFWVGLGSQVVSLVTMVFLAFLNKSPSSLAWGGLAGTIFTCITSHFYYPGRINRFRLNRNHARQIMRFGGIVLVSSTLTFACGQGINLLMGSLIDMKTMGIVSIATSLSGLCVAVSTMFSGKILFPAYAELHREATHHKLYAAVGKARAVQVIFICIYSLIIILIAGPLIEFFYDSRYHQVALVMEVMAIGNLAVALNISYETLDMAIGRPDLKIRVVIAMAASLWVAVFTGHYYWGDIGVIYGIAASGWLSYPFISYIYSRVGFWYPKIDLPVIFLSIAALFIFVRITPGLT